MSTQKLQLPVNAGSHETVANEVQEVIGGQNVPKKEGIQLPMQTSPQKEKASEPQMQMQTSVPQEAEAVVESDGPSIEQQYIFLNDKFTKFKATCTEKVAGGVTDFAEMKKEMGTFFQEEIFSFLKTLHVQNVQAECDKIHLDEQIGMLFTRRQKADLVKQRYEVLAREYNDQNKQFGIRHDEITKQERDKRESIQKGFDDHLNGIKAQLEEENKKNKEAIDEISKENEDLATKYEELKKEIDDKSQQMTDQLVEKKKTAGEIQEQITSQIDQQEIEIKKQGEAYSTQHEIKLQEEQKLIEVLKEYRSKSKEFEKATKKSRQSYNQFDKDIKGLNKRITALEAEKKKAEKVQAGKEPKNLTELVDKMEKDWAAEREGLEKTRDEFKVDCANLQHTIKNM